MRKILFCIAVVWALGLVDAAQAAPNAAEETATSPWEACAGQTARTERTEGIPHRLLHAIALAESERWNAERNATIAWPWTVTAEGQGLFFPTKAEAIADVEHLHARGVQNIDVGCMQVNLHYHGDAFDDLNEAFDPARNVDYASAYLKRMHGDRRSWPEAAAAYHSTTPEFAGPYRDKVMGIWKTERSAPPTRVATREVSNERATRLPAPPRTKLVSGAPSPVPGRASASDIDHVRTHALNVRFQLKRAVARTQATAETRNRELGAWREARVGGLGTTHVSAMIRAEARLRETQTLFERAERTLNTGPGSGTRPGFAAKREAELASWRARIASTTAGL